MVNITTQNKKVIKRVIIAEQIPVIFNAEMIESNSEDVIEE